MSRILFLLIFLLGLGQQRVAAQTSADRWEMHLSYRDGTQCLRDGHTLYTLFAGNLAAYDTRTGEFRTFDRVSHGLSARRITHMGLSTAQRCLILVYADNSLDLLHLADETVTHMPYLKRASESGITVRHLEVTGQHALVATSEGVVWIDLAARTVQGNYALGDCQDATLFDGRIFAALASGATISAATTANLSDRSQWRTEQNIGATRLLSTGRALYLFVPYTTEATMGIWHMPATGGGPYQPERIVPLGFLDAFLTPDGTAVFPSWTIIYAYADGSRDATVVQKPNSGISFAPDGAGSYWVGLDNGGFIHARLTDGGLSYDQPLATIGGFGPRMDRAYFMQYDFEQNLLLAAGRLDPYDLDHVEQAAMRFDGKDWTLFAPPGAADGAIGHLFSDATSIARDPRQPDRYVVTTGRTGIYDYELSATGKSTILRQYTDGDGISGIRSVLAATSSSYQDYVRTDGAIFDQDGNLFVLNNRQDTCLRVRRPDGSWRGIYVADIRQAPQLEKTLIDSKGRLWITSRRTITDHNGGFLCLDYNRTPDIDDDDVATYRSSLINQDGISTPIMGYSFALDRTGRLWLGTDQGLFVVDDPDRWGDADFRATQIKVPRNDGTNYADYLLAGVPITAIAVDGADRKWIGTQGDGLYLVSADGLTTVHHFTTTNSPLLSDNIWSLACHPTSGRVMVGMDEGLMAYRGDASEPQPDLLEAYVRIYPNPVRPDYRGEVVLDGLSADADIKVTNTAGLTVAHGRSLGGMFRWDTRGYDGTPVGSGVYFFHTTDAQGQKTVVGKLAIVR